MSLYQDDEDALSIGVLTLAYLLPMCGRTPDVHRTIERLAALLDGLRPQIVQLAVFALRRIALLNVAHCEHITTAKLGSTIVAILESTSNLAVKLEALSFLRLLARKSRVAVLLIPPP